MNTKAKKSKPVKAVALIGSASSTKDNAPYDNKDIEIWGLAWRHDLPRCDRYFEIHVLDGPEFEIRKKGEKIGSDYIKEHLAKLPCPVVIQKPNPDIPNHVAFPLKAANEYLAKFDVRLTPEGASYWASSCAFMFVMAMMEEFTDIQLFGIDLVDDDEYSYQRPNLEYLIGLARGMGISVLIPDKSALCKFPHVYGFEKFEEDTGVITLKALNDRVKMYSDKHQKAMCEAFTADGARQEAAQLVSILKGRKKGKVL